MQTQQTNLLTTALAAIFDRAGVTFVDDRREPIAAASLLQSSGVLPCLTRDAERLSAAVGLSRPEAEILPSDLGLFGERVQFKHVGATTTMIVLEAARLRFGLPASVARWQGAQIDISSVRFDAELPLPPETSYGNRAR
jgi:hypothetical protein